MNIPAFQAKWQGVTLKERSASQEHFLDLCHALNVPTPAEADPNGTFYTFEKGAEKTGGGKGFADVWFRGHFAWEYKGRHADLVTAYRQLLQYREDLENPPLLVVCDLDRFEVHTNWTNTAKRVYRFTLADLDQPATLAILRAVFTNPEALRPDVTPEAVTEEAAARFGALAAGLHSRGVDPQRAAHFLVQLLFCLFAEDVGLLPRGLFTDLLTLGARRPELFPGQVEALLTAMRDGGVFGVAEIARFNGGLFAEIGVEPLTAGELKELREAASLDWGSVEPAIFGTLFERSLDPGKRAQLGAHYTGRADIERVVEPVLMAPMRRRWEEVREEADRRKAAWDAATTPQTRANRRAAFAGTLAGFGEELAAIRVLDPACGSGNFLYVALAKLLDLEKAVAVYGATNGLPMGLPQVGPRQLAGLEINAYARELAQVVVWIGYLQWMIGNGFGGRRDPVLEPLETIRLQDALIDRSDPDHPREAVWPEADVIIGNPPFLGDKKMRGELGNDSVEALWRVYRGRVPSGADLVCYFFERTRAEIEAGRVDRAGLLATQAIRMGASRRILERIKQSGDIFLAWDDEPWTVNGAQVRISIVGFDNGSEKDRFHDGQSVQNINADLTTATDVTTARALPENSGVAFFGDCKGGPFDVPIALAEGWLQLPTNPNGRPNSDVVKRRINGQGVMQGNSESWIVDFGPSATEGEAALYEAPFEYVLKNVAPIRALNRDVHLRRYWWLHQRPRPEMRAAVEHLSRFLVTPTVAKHRVFAWVGRDVIPDHKLVVFARQDDYFFGAMQSRAHVIWSLRTASRHGVGNDPVYNIGSCFETFPLPWSPGQEPWDDPRLHAIAEAARELDERRRAWLDPEGANEAELKTRTLTNLYNARPTWLANLHAALDRAVWDAYGWDDSNPALTEEDAILGQLLALNAERSAATGDGVARMAADTIRSPTENVPGRWAT
jgi:type II restriction/modification system DNA methylase subunit YeeA